MPSQDTIRAMWRALEVENVRSSDQVVAVMKSAEVSAAHLTGSPEWDRFLSWIQPLMNESEGLCRQSQLDVFMGLTEQERQKVMNTYWYYRGAADAYAKVIAKPTELLTKQS